MLKRPIGLAVMLALVAFGSRSALADAARTKAASGRAASKATGDGVPRAIAEPVRLTAGASSDLMGVLGSDEKSLYFVSDASGTLDIMRQAPVQSGPVTISGGLGDAAWPQISPDGQHIAYISFENDSTGDVCVRDISEEGAASAARCLTNADSAELMALWWNDTSLAVLSRPGLHGDFRLQRMPIDDGAPTTIVARNMVGVALSPDRRWLAYIPVNKAVPEVGINFAQRAAVGVGLARVGSAGEPLLYVPRLPGVTGSVAFSPQGDYLQFAQFLNDTNRDGAIDGNDNAVLFRVAFRPSAPSPIRADDEPEQLTSARWDCHYPAPAKTRMIASCSHEGSLDVYSLPLEGAVPAQWDDARLVAESAVARDLWTRLLLAGRRLVLARSELAKEPVLTEMIALHLELGEYEAAIYYAENRLVSAGVRRFAHVVAELARHRRADLALIRGETSAQYIDSERARADGLRAELSGPPEIALLAALVISEIEDDIGDKAASHATFQKVPLDRLAEPIAISLAARRAQRLYRLRGEQQPLLDTYRVLSTLPALDAAHRIEYAARFVAELGRGRSRSERLVALAAAEAKVDPASELGMLIAVEKVLTTLDDASQETVRKEIFELYKQTKDADRRRALVLSTLQAAAKAGNEYIQYQFITTWASSLDRRHPERKYAEALYDAIVLDRAYGEGRQGRKDESRGYFYGGTVATDSLEAHIGFIEARLAEGGPDASESIDQAYEKRFARDPDSPSYAFVKAYRIARELPHERDAERHEQGVSRASELCAKVAEALPKQAQVHQLWGFVLHQRARRNGSREAAVDANRQYLLALDLARGDERLTATLLHRLGLLQASLGNHGAALRYLRRRDELPHVRVEEELGLCVAIARSAWHSGDYELAKHQMQRAAELVRENPALGRYEALVVDRLGLTLAAAGDASAARDRYAELDRLLARDPKASPINHVKAKLGLAANALESGQAAKALEALAAADRVLDSGDELYPKPDVVWRRSLIDDYRYSPVQYRALVAGLRAGADRALEDHGAALSATALRVELLEKRLSQTSADEDRLELAQAYHHLAELHDTLGDPNAAARAVEKGLALSAQYDENTGGEVNDAGLALIRDYAELHLYRGIKLEALRRDLKGELERIYAVICKYRNPRWSLQRYLFKTYLTELMLNERL